MKKVMTAIESMLHEEMEQTASNVITLDAGTLGMTGYSREQISVGIQRLVDSGRWDYIPAMGIQSNVFFNIPALLQETTPITDSARELAAVTLAARDTFSKYQNWEQLSGADRDQVIDVSIRCNPAIIEGVMKQSTQLVSFHSVNNMSIALSSYYLSNAGFAVLSHRQLALMTRSSKKVIRESVKALVKTGLWGVIKGTGSSNSRFFPLFTDEGSRAFDLALSLTNFH